MRSSTRRIVARVAFACIMGVTLYLQRKRRQKRKRRTRSSSSSSGRVVPIGTVRSIYTLCVGTPRQGQLAPNARGRIELNNPHLIVGLSEFSHIWVTFLFHLNTQGRKTPTKIAPPALGGHKVGVLATRSPHRQNPIGLSLVTLDRIENQTLYISGLDLVDGTPVLDIKPYVPQYDALPTAVVPEWVSRGLNTSRTVHIVPQAQEELKAIVREKQLAFYSDYDDIYQCIRQVLRYDVRSAWQTKKARAGKSQSQRSSRITTGRVRERPDLCSQQLDNLLIWFRLEEGHGSEVSKHSGADDTVIVEAIEVLQRK